MPLRLGFDVDGVVADFRSAFLEAAAGILGREAIDRPAADFETLSPADAKRVWDVIVNEPNWWVRVPPYEPAQIGRLYQLARRFRWEVLFLTSRVTTAGDSVQFQTQAWLEAHGYYIPAVFTVPGSRGEVANSLRLDLIVDDQFMNCAEVVAASQAKTLLVLRADDPVLNQQATDSGIGVVKTLEDAIDVLLHLQEILPGKRTRRLADWFLKRNAEGHVLPMNPRVSRAVPPAGEK